MSYVSDTVAGYSISIGEKNDAPLYFMGAPRFEHAGQVILFRHNYKNWTIAQRINGDQVGKCVKVFICFIIHILKKIFWKKKKKPKCCT